MPQRLIAPIEILTNQRWRSLHALIQAGGTSYLCAKRNCVLFVTVFRAGYFGSVISKDLQRINLQHTSGMREFVDNFEKKKCFFFECQNLINFECSNCTILNVRIVGFFLATFD